jgi:hypothetical protein
LDRLEVNAKPGSVPTVPVNKIWSTIRDYVLWSYERGTVQYDVMVTLILLFLFFSPYYINYKDKPVEHVPHRTEVVVAPDGHGGFIYNVEASAISGHDDDAVRSELIKIIEPISGEVSISKIEPVKDRTGRIQTYKVWLQRD